MDENIFVQRFNPISGEEEWITVNSNTDQHTANARVSYADMLHDKERNEMYSLALKKAIQKLHNRGEKAHVLDIGTGSGLLSMLAVQHGADTVTACEAFAPVAACAAKVIADNKYSEMINLVKKHSIYLTVGENCDMDQKANILVTEVFDTELIGEGAIKTFNHAHEFLLEEDAIVIPSSSTIFAQVVHSDFVQSWNKLNNWNYMVDIPSEIKGCCGSAAVHDVQLSMIPEDKFTAMSPIIKVFEFDWTSQHIPSENEKLITVRSLSSGTAQAVFVWWDLVMDTEGEIILSCAPIWAHPQAEKNGMKAQSEGMHYTSSIPWRDHWMQSIYYFSSELEVKEHEDFKLVCNHDEYSLWFTALSGSESVLSSAKPMCKCGLHFLFSRTRIGAINDKHRQELYLKTLNNIVRSNSTVVVIGDSSMLSIICSKLGAKKVLALEKESLNSRVLKNIITQNKANVTICQTVDEITSILCAESQKDGGILIISEPYFNSSLLPWENLSFMYLKHQLMRSIHFSHVCTTSPTTIKVMPKKGRLMGMAVEFDHLWKIQAPVKECEGLNLKIFDEFIRSSAEKADKNTEPQPLWEYPCKALSKPDKFYEVDFTKPLPIIKVNYVNKMLLSSEGRCDGVAIWMEYDLDDESILSFGPRTTPKLNKYVEWDMYERQGVHFFYNRQETTNNKFILIDFQFDPIKADFKFDFSFKSSI